MRAKQLVPYLGEFLLVPWATELSLIEPCDYACTYCFAILGDRARKHYTDSSTVHAVGVKEALTNLAKCRESKSLEGYFLRQGYPILMSNRTDPFGRKNRVPVLAFLEIFQELGVPVAFQTKGFIRHDQDFERVMALVQPSWWYITIAQENDALRQRIEPGAPPIEYRLELATELVRRGHQVCIGLNPYCPEWIQSPEKFLARLKKTGASQIAIQLLHLSPSNRTQMRPREKQRLHGGDTTWFDSFAGKRSPPSNWIEAYQQIHGLAVEAGFLICGRESGLNQDVWGEVRRLYPRALPTIADYVFHCYQTKQHGDVIRWEDWRDWVLPQLPKGPRQIGHAIRIQSWTLCEKIQEVEGWAKWKTTMDYETLLRIAWEWQSRLSGLTPFSSSAFCPLLDDDDTPLSDDEGRPLLAFAPYPSNNPLDQYAGWYA